MNSEECHMRPEGVVLVPKVGERGRGHCSWIGGRLVHNQDSGATSCRRREVNGNVLQPGLTSSWRKLSVFQEEITANGDLVPIKRGRMTSDAGQGRW